MLASSASNPVLYAITIVGPWPRLSVVITNTYVKVYLVGNVLITDTYVKTYLVGNGKRLQKRRTKTAKESTDPLYRQKLKYSACNVHGRHMQVGKVVPFPLAKSIAKDL